MQFTGGRYAINGFVALLLPPRAPVRNSPYGLTLRRRHEFILDSKLAILRIAEQAHGSRICAGFQPFEQPAGNNSSVGSSDGYFAIENNCLVFGFGYDWRPMRVQSRHLRKVLFILVCSTVPALISCSSLA